MVLVLPCGTDMTGPRLPRLKSYSRFMALFIFPPLLPSRNEPHPLPAPGVDDHQNSAESIHSERDPPFFFKVRIGNGQRRIILEPAGGICEVDPVLRDVRLGLDWILFAVHDSLVCTNVHCEAMTYLRGRSCQISRFHLHADEVRGPNWKRKS